MKRIRMRGIMLGTFLLAALGGCSSVELKADPVISELGADVYANPRLYIQYGDDIDVSKADVYAVSPGIVKTGNRFVSSGLNYLQTGDYDFMLEYKGRQYPFTIKVKDTAPPSCTSIPGSVSVPVGGTIDWAQVYDARDLSGVYYESSPVDTGTAGSMDVNVKISDRFGNSTTRTITVNVGI